MPDQGTLKTIMYIQQPTNLSSHGEDFLDNSEKQRLRCSTSAITTSQKKHWKYSKRIFDLLWFWYRPFK